MESKIVALLRDDPAVTALVGTRIYPLMIPESGAKPAIVYQRIAEREDKCADGRSGLKTVKLQIDCWADSFKTAREIAAAVDTVLDAYSGTVADLNLQAIWKESQLDRYEPETSEFGSTLEYTIQYED